VEKVLRPSSKEMKNNEEETACLICEGARAVKERWREVDENIANSFMDVNWHYNV
jgi:hypothetical protein